jgi:hypothetical protein
VSINVVRIINKLKLNNPKPLFVISYKGAFRLSMERVSGCVKINRIILLELIHCGGGVGVIVLALGPDLIPSGEGWWSYLLI